MSETIDRSYPGPLASAPGNTFLQAFNADRERVYGHLAALEAMVELLARVVGNGTIEATDLRTEGNQVCCPSGYKAIVGGVPVVTGAELSQGCPAEVQSYVFLRVAPTGLLSLRVGYTDAANVDEVLVAAIGADGIVDNEPEGKPHVV